MSAASSNSCWRLASSGASAEAATVPNPTPDAQALIGAMLRRAIAGRVPLNGSIAMTHRCHLRCVHCYLGDERRPAPRGAGAETRPDPGELGTEFWLSVVDQAAEAGCLNLLITGGEPLLRPDFAHVYERAKRRGMLVTVFTNGTLVDERTLSLFQALPPDVVEITLYGASTEVYEGVTGVPGSFGRCLQAVDSLLTRGIRLGLKAVILKDNQDQIRAMRDMASQRKVPFRVDPALFPCRDGNMSPLDHRVCPEDAVSLEAEDEQALHGLAKFYERMRGLPPEKALFACMAGLTSFHVDPSGTLLPCMMVTTHGFDLRQGTFRSGWEEVLPRFREQPIAEGYECHRCETRFVCGICPAQFAMETGSPYRKAEYYCQLGEARLRAMAAIARASDGGPD
jgi:radical SAM protein with 4Fe4S-binding SPASM domain